MSVGSRVSALPECLEGRSWEEEQMGNLLRDAELCRETIEEKTQVERPGHRVAIGLSRRQFF